MRDIPSIRRLANDRLCHLRSIIRILNSKKFVQAYNQSSDEEKENLYIVTYNSDKESLNRWIKKVLGEKSIYELHDEAYRLGMSNIKKMSKEELEWNINARTRTAPN